MDELVSHSNIRVLVKLLPNDEDNRTNFDDYFDSLENPFRKLNTETKCKKYLSEKWGIVESIEVALGVTYDTRSNRTTGTYDQVPNILLNLIVENQTFPRSLPTLKNDPETPPNDSSYLIKLIELIQFFTLAQWNLKPNIRFSKIQSKIWPASAQKHQMPF